MNTDLLKDYLLSINKSAWRQYRQLEKNPDFDFKILKNVLIVIINEAEEMLKEIKTVHETMKE